MSPVKDPDIVWEPVDDAAYCTLQAAVPIIDWVRLQIPVKVPEPDGVTEKFTEPVGVIGLPLDWSFTVAVHELD